MSPYGYYQSAWGGQQRPQPGYHERSIHQTIALNNNLNAEAQASIDAREPKVNIWDKGALDAAMSQLSIAAANDKKRPIKASDNKFPDEKQPIKASDEKHSDETRQSLAPSSANGNAEKLAKVSRLSSFRKSIGIKSIRRESSCEDRKDGG